MASARRRLLRRQVRALDRHAIDDRRFRATPDDARRRSGARCFAQPLAAARAHRGASAGRQQRRRRLRRSRDSRGRGARGRSPSAARAGRLPRRRRARAHDEFVAAGGHGGRLAAGMRCAARTHRRCDLRHRIVARRLHGVAAQADRAINARDPGACARHPERLDADTGEVHGVAVRADAHARIHRPQDSASISAKGRTARGVVDVRSDLELPAQALSHVDAAADAHRRTAVAAAVAAASRDRAQGRSGQCAA